MTAILRLQLDDKDPVRVNSAINQLAEFVDRGGGGTGGGRTLLTVNTTYYVATTGSDTNPGTSGSPFLTIQHAYDVIVSTLDLAGHVVTIQAAAGTYTTGLAMTSSWAGGGSITLDLGGGALHTTSGDAISVAITLPGKFTVQNGTLTTTTAGFCIIHSGTGSLYIGSGITFGACAYSHIVSNGAGSKIILTNNYSISGGVTGAHYLAIGSGANISNTVPITVTITGTPATPIFTQSTRLSDIELGSMTYSGATTGSRYIVDTNAVIFTGGGGANYFPGSSPGSFATGGIYA